MYRIAIEDELKKKDIRKGRQQLAFAVEASKQQDEATFTNAEEVGEFAGKVFLGIFPRLFD